VAPTLSHIILVADRRALNQILTAVLTNAAAGTSEGDWIELTAEQDSENWSLCIQDEGVGLDLAAPPAPPTGETWRVSDTRGIGPGLALSASLMRAHGGALRVEAAMRIGTRVRLSFPKTRLLT
jgi:two-component system cell cycle sensor histidine kinase PleC